MIKKFYRRSQAFHSFHGHSFFSICSVFVLFCFCFVCFFKEKQKQKHKVSHFYLFFVKTKWNLGRNLYIFIHSLINSKSNELPQFGPPLKQMNG